MSKFKSPKLFKHITCCTLLTASFFFSLSDKSNSTTFALVHRPQNDPKIHDDASSSMVFQELAPSQAHKIKNRIALESELFGASGKGVASTQIRDNEGEAAEYGVYFDDTEYDYMQHMRDLNGGSGDGESYFLEAPKKRGEGKGKAKISLADALRDASLEDRRPSSQVQGSGLLDASILPSNNLSKTTYQDQQDVPDMLAGFQPDMDPRLREVLEALEDDAYVDDEEDIFGELAKDGKEVSISEFEDLVYDEDIGGVEDDDGWESDATAKPANNHKSPRVETAAESTAPNDTTADITDTPMEDLGENGGESEWMKEFSKFKTAEKAKKAKGPSQPDKQSSILTGTSVMSGMRRKKRKGAMTDSSSYSMTSSSLLRTEGLTLLDARFDKIEEEYAEDGGMMYDDDGGASVTTASSKASSQAFALPLRADFDNIMDDFLENYQTVGRKRVKKGKNQTGMEQLDEIRKELGPPKIPPKIRVP